MKPKVGAAVGLVSFLVMILSIGGGFILLRYGIDVPWLAYGGFAGVVGVVAFIEALLTRLRERSR